MLQQFTVCIISFNSFHLYLLNYTNNMKYLVKASQFNSREVQMTASVTDKSQCQKHATISKIQGTFNRSVCRITAHQNAQMKQWQ